MRRAVALAAGLALSACSVTVTPQPPVAAPAPVAPATVAGVPAGMQYLYGSGEAVAASRQAYDALAWFIWESVTNHAKSLPARPGLAPPAQIEWQSVVLAPGSTLARPQPVACAKRLPAIVLDVDETVLLNTGYEYADARGGLSYDAARWERWERSDGRATRAVPGAAEALARIRGLGVAVIFNSNRNAATAAFTERALAAAGLGPARHGETLFLRGDAPGGSAKDARRATIAARYCVIAMAGDQLGDFSDLFNAGLKPAERRAAADAAAIAGLWGRGWFILPNPVYGPALAGDFDDVFPNDLRWSDPGAAGNPRP